MNPIQYIPKGGVAPPTYKQPQVPSSLKLNPNINRVDDSIPERKLKRSLNFYADFSGCGHWRMIWPEKLINMNQKLNISGGTVMVGDPAFYYNVQTIRIQRQATDPQYQFVKFLKKIQKQQPFNLIYEIDDIIFIEDIPRYNKFRSAFDDPKIRDISMKIMAECNEITVTCDYMKQYYHEKTGNKNITIVPNYVPRFWMDRYYNHTTIMKNYEKNKDKPRIVYCGSGAHFDVDNRVKQKDDFEHLVQTVRNTYTQYQWVFLGGFPIPCLDLLKEGKIEFHKWHGLQDYPKKVWELNPTILIAPLQDNIFNKAKSDLKFIEACCFGIPSVVQDMVTYENAFNKFKTGDELIDQIKRITKDPGTYSHESKKARNYSDTRWLEDNLDAYIELYSLPYKHKDRKKLNTINF